MRIKNKHFYNISKRYWKYIFKVIHNLENQLNIVFESNVSLSY